MSEKNRLLYLILIMTFCAFLVGGFTFYELYNTAIEEQREWLINTAQSQARLLEAVARFDAKYSVEDHPNGADAATLSQIVDAHKQYKGFGETGEFTLAKQEKDKMVFLLSHRHYDLDNPKPVPFYSGLAEPMERALSGKSGTMVGLDYRGVKVLAAFEPVQLLNLGIVAKMDIVEIRKPFIVAAIKAGIIAIILIMAGSIFFMRITNPIIKNLQESKGRLAKAQEIAHMGNWNWNIGNNELTCSDEIYRIFGVKPSEFGATYKAFLKSVHPDDRDFVKKEVNKALNKGQAYSIDHRIVRPDGEERIVHVQAEVYLDENGKALKIFGTVQDITERKQAELKLYKFSRALKAISECNEVLTRVTDESELLHSICKIIVNVGGYRLAWVGFAEHDTAKTVRPVAEVGYEEGYLESINITWADNEQGRSPTGTAIRTSKLSIAKNITTDPDYTAWRAEAIKRGYTSSIGLPLIIDDKAFGVLNIYSEKPDAFDGEEVNLLSKLADDLAYGIKSLRTKIEHKLYEKEREELIKEMELKNAEMERFIYTVSHDLKSPLVTINGFLGFLEKDFLKGNKERINDDVDRIRNAAEKMERLLDELLELSRIGRVINPPERVSLRELANEALELVAGQIAERNVKVEIAPDLPVIFVDRRRFLEVTQNLLENAVKYMGNQKKPCIEIGYRKDGTEIVFYIKDNGMGIDSRYHKKVFELFDKLDNKSKGSGIGLAIVERIVELHGGRIWVESRGAGKGSTFCFTIGNE